MSMRTATVPPDTLAAQSLEGSRSLIDRHTTVEGTLATPHDLRIEGRVTGVLQCDGVLYVAAGAEVDADIAATDAIVEGTIAGSITCSGRLEVRSTGVVQAVVKTHRLVIHEGAVLEGRLDMESVSDAAETDAAEGSVEAPVEVADSSSESASSYSYLRNFSSPAASSSRGDTDLPGQEARDDSDDDTGNNPT